MPHDCLHTHQAIEWHKCRNNAFRLFGKETPYDYPHTHQAIELHQCKNNAFTLLKKKCHMITHILIRQQCFTNAKITCLHCWKIILYHYPRAHQAIELHQYKNSASRYLKIQIEQ